jgi:broad specificity phosphatase PhoE
MMRPRRRGTRRTEEGPEGAAAATVPARQRFAISLNMLSNDNIKFYTEGESRAEAVARWRAAIGRAKREHPEDAVEVVMGGANPVVFVVYLAEVAGFVIASSFDEEDYVIDCTVNV